MSVGEHPTSVRTAIAGSLLASFGLQAIVAVSGVLAARMLGVTDRGNFAQLWLVAIVLAQLATLSVPAAVTYFAADGRASGGAMLRSIKRLAGLQLAALLMVHAMALWGIAHDEAADVQMAALITLLPMPALLAHQYGQAVLQGRHRFRLYNRQRALPMVLYSLGLGGAFVLGSGSLVSVAAIWAGATALGAGSTLVVAWADLRRDGVSGPESAPPTRTSLRFGLRSLLGTFTGFEQLLLDQAIVALMMPTQALGLYVVAIAFSNLPRLVGQSIGMVAFPAVARAAAERRAAVPSRASSLPEWSSPACWCAGSSSPSRRSCPCFSDESSARQFRWLRSCWSAPCVKASDVCSPMRLGEPDIRCSGPSPRYPHWRSCSRRRCFSHRPMD